MQCWPPRRNFPCSLREVYKVYTVFEESIFYFSSLRSYGREECSDYNVAGEFSKMAENFSLKAKKR